MAVPGNLPQFQILVAFNNLTLDDPGNITTVASPPGTLGGANVWTDISQQVTSAQWSRGRQHELVRFDAGNGTADLLNLDGRFSPWNTSSPYTGKILVGVPFRIQATWLGVTYVLFTGHVKSWPIRWPAGMDARAQITFADAFAFFNNANLTNFLYDQQVVTDGATHLWPMNDPAGRNLADTIPNFGPVWGAVHNVNQTVASGLAGPAGPIMLVDERAVNLGSYNTAANQTYIDVTGAGFTGNQSWTVECWIKTNTVGIYAATQFGSYSAGYRNTWILTVEPAGWPAMTVYNSAGASVKATGNFIADGVWHQVVATWDGTNVRMYTDGTLVSTQAPGGSLAMSSTGLTVWGGTVNSSGVVASAFGGLNLGRCAFYGGVALTAAQVTNHLSLGAGAGAGTSDTQVTSILNAVSWPSGARNIDVGNGTFLQNTTNLVKTKCLNYLQYIDQSEMGALFMDATGKVRFISRHNLLVNSRSYTAQVTYGDGGSPGELPFLPDPDLALDDLDLYNTAWVTRNGGIEQTSADATSAAQYGARIWIGSSMLHLSDSDSLFQSQWVVANHKTPAARLRVLSVRPANDSNLPPKVLATELMDRAIVNRHTVPGGGTVFNQEALVEKIEHTVNFQTAEWVAKFGLSPLEANRYWIVGDSTYGVIGTAKVAW